jgi:hypothetical protein
MVGRVAADPKNNPAVRGVLDRPSLARPTFGGLKKERERKGVIRPRSPMKDQLHLRERRDKVLEKIACSRGAFARIEAFSYRAGNRLAGSIWIADAHRGRRKAFRCAC